MSKKDESATATPVIAEPTAAEQKPKPPTVEDMGARLSKGDAWKHAAARALHGWAEHAHHTGAPMELSAEDYAAALEAACNPGKSGSYEPHPAALSPHAAISKRAKR